MKRGNWVPIDKRAVAFLPIDRPYTVLEAIVSYAVDRDNRHRGTIAGYAKLWQWDRKRVRKFIKTIKVGADYKGGTPRGTGKAHPVRYVFNNIESTEGQQRDTQRDTTIDPDPKPKEYNGALREALRPTSFLNYLKGLKDFDKEKAHAVAYYLDRYKHTTGDDHPHLRPDQWDRAMGSIFSGYDGDTGQESGPDDFESARGVIDRHFQTDYRGCDFSILHFVSGKILYLRSRECGF